MEILGVGWQELIFIVIIALIVLGPKDMQKAGKTIGRWLNQLVNSDTWKVFQQTSGELRNLPRNLMKEANMEMQETERELRRTLDQIDSRTNPSTASSHIRSRPPSNKTENTIQPPAAKPASAPAAVPSEASLWDSGESSAEDGAGSSDRTTPESKTSTGSSDNAQNTNLEEHD